MKPKIGLLILDRDGVILKHKDPYILQVKDIEFIPGSKKSIKHIAARGIPIAVVTNQSPIRRGLITAQFVKKTHVWIQNAVALNRNQIKFYYCPHRLEDRCNCRKPQIGMLKRACDDFKVNPSNCWMLGDHDSDMQAAKNMSINKRIHLLSGRQATPSRFATEIKADLSIFTYKYFTKGVLYDHN